MTMNNYPKPELLSITTRGDSPETLHYGWICVLNKDKKIIFQKGSISDKVFLRSAAKPIQAIPLTECIKGLTPKEIAIICGSHTGSKEHINVLNGFIKKYKLLVTNLQCGIHQPLDETERNRLIKQDKKPIVLHNNCSGKHLGMLLCCKKNNWDLKTYLNLNHKLQKSIINHIKNLSEVKNLSVATDGCSAPTFSLPIINIAKLFSNFTNPEYSQYKKYKKIIMAMNTYPYYVGGKGQIDSEIMRSSKLNLISKVGAEGIIVAAYNGNSAIIKIADGSPKIRSTVFINLLLKLKWISKSSLKGNISDDILNGLIKNHSGKIVGRINTLI